MMDLTRRGWGAIEALLLASILVPIALAALSPSLIETRGPTNGPREGDDLAAAVEELDRLLRPAVRSSFRVRASEADANAAAEPRPERGAWIPPVPGDPRPGVRFQVLRGVASDRLAELTEPTEVELRMDGGERVNGADDDGDGLIDEGVLLLRRDSVETVLLEGVEVFSAAFDGESIRVTVSQARARQDGTIERAVAVRDLVIRNR